MYKCSTVVVHWLPFVPSGFTGAIAGNWRYSTGDIEGALLYVEVYTGEQVSGGYSGPIEDTVYSAGSRRWGRNDKSAVNATPQRRSDGGSDQANQRGRGPLQHIRLTQGDSSPRR